jgi:hypothetical protein
MTSDTSEGPSPWPDAPKFVVWCSSWCSASLLASIVNATGAWGSSAGRESVPVVAG